MGRDLPRVCGETQPQLSCHVLPRQHRCWELQGWHKGGFTVSQEGTGQRRQVVVSCPRVWWGRWPWCTASHDHDPAGLVLWPKGPTWGKRVCWEAQPPWGLRGYWVGMMGVARSRLRLRGNSWSVPIQVALGEGCQPRCTGPEPCHGEQWLVWWFVCGRGLEMCRWQRETHQQQ